MRQPLERLFLLSLAQAPSDSCVIFRVCGSLELSCWLESSSGRLTFFDDQLFVFFHFSIWSLLFSRLSLAVSQSQRSLSKAFNDLRDKLREQSLVFHVCNSSLFIWPNQDCQASLGNVTANTPCGDLQKHIEWVSLMISFMGLFQWLGYNPDGRPVTFYSLFIEWRTGMEGVRRKGKTRKMGWWVLICHMVKWSFKKSQYAAPRLKLLHSFIIPQTVINLTLMAEVTIPGEENLSAPYLSTEKKRHSLSMALPMDCVLSTAADESVRTWVLCSSSANAFTFWVDMMCL